MCVKPLDIFQLGGLLAKSQQVTWLMKQKNEVELFL